MRPSESRRTLEMCELGSERRQEDKINSATLLECDGGLAFGGDDVGASMLQAVMLQPLFIAPD